MNGYEQRTLRKKLDIINATKYLVCNYPVRNISIEMIAKEAKVSPVTIYNIFGSKKLAINEAIRILADEDRDDILSIISSSLPIKERLYQYFNHSFNHTIERPQQRALFEYIFSSENIDLQNYVVSGYGITLPFLTKLYEDGRKENLIQEGISVELFFKMLDMYTRIERSFLLIPEEKDIIINSIINSFH
ncbi:MAG: TetR/AcrR family transcriptional regulator [Clostridiales bacterium]|nr:TetR/AcrR family transcriptional regulator [Clostridiales bacterium]